MVTSIMRASSLLVSTFAMCLAPAVCLALTLSRESSGRTFSVKAGENVSINLGPEKWAPTHKLTGVLRQEGPFQLRAVGHGRERIHYECSNPVQSAPKSFWAYVNVDSMASSTLVRVSSDPAPMTVSDLKHYLQSEKYRTAVDRALKPLGAGFEIKNGQKHTSGNRTVITVFYRKTEPKSHGSKDCADIPNATPILTMVLAGDNLVSVNIKGSRYSSVADSDEGGINDSPAGTPNDLVLNTAAASRSSTVARSSSDTRQKTVDSNNPGSTCQSNSEHDRLNLQERNERRQAPTEQSLLDQTKLQDTVLSESTDSEDNDGPLFASGSVKALRVVVDLGRQRAFLLRGKTIQRKYIISSGKPGYRTPTGWYQITAIKRNSWWYPPKSPWAKGLKPIPPGPSNPMGPVKMQLSGTAYYLHGIPRKAEARLGSPASHGCIRMRSSDALHLASVVHIGTSVHIVTSCSYR